tara:strand:+ start:340 stop:939 length:600 start_codon:yes stop_codon:yes gene_type:complete
MPLSVDDLKGAVRSGPARSNMFQVNMPALPGLAQTDTRGLNLLCRDIQLPGRQVMTNERIIGMKQVKQAYGYASEDVSMTFLVTNDYGVKAYFEHWQELAANHFTKELNYPNTYTRDVTIHQLKHGLAFDVPGFFDQSFSFGPFNISLDADVYSDEQKIYSCKLVEAFCTTLNAIQLNNDPNGLVELNVQLSYKDWFEI